MTGDFPIREAGGEMTELTSQIASCPETSWLNPAERTALASLAGHRRRATWLAGRWCAKQLVHPLVDAGHGENRRAGIRLAEIAIISTDGRGRGHPPAVYVNGAAEPISLSVAHTSRWVAVALDERPGTPLGVDIVDCASTPRSLATTWFTHAEQRWLDRRATEGDVLRIWSAKEACYKAIHSHRPFDPRNFEVTVLSDVEGWATRVNDGIGRCIRWTYDACSIRAVAYCRVNQGSHGAAGPQT